LVSPANSHSTSFSTIIIIIIIHHLGTGTIGQTVAVVPCGLSLTPCGKKNVIRPKNNFTSGTDMSDHLLQMDHRLSRSSVI
jgi:hypothetical protein